MRKPTFKDIAARAGVGTATVERVLNGRGGVSPGAAQKVLKAARDLGYPRVLPEAHRGLLRIEVLLVQPHSMFFRRLSRSFERIAATLNPLVVVQRTFIEELNPAEIARRIASPETRRAALILAVPDHPLIRDAVSHIAASGLPVISIITGITGHAGDHVGIDNHAAGRTAAMFMARMARGRGPVLALAHPIYQVHRDRIQGFSDYVADHEDQARFEWLGFSMDKADRSTDLLFRALRDVPDLGGLYNAGGTNAALIDLLRQQRPRRPLFFVGHELTDYTAAALREGLMDIVLDQAPEAQARRALDLALRRIGLTQIEPDTAPIRFTTITVESL
ncbi:LacI family DNA-binding transcriptional regulator [Paracoccus sp. (in: a-proteobacteria)]|uniref:LacI family DNA-binding transcriptional regulator n=1 Tax=Paracoccus sp. TaxID=267 RepID=UPI0035B0788D